MLRLPIIRSCRGCQRIVFFRDQQCTRESRSASTSRLTAGFSSSCAIAELSSLTRTATEQAGCFTFRRHIQLGVHLYGNVIDVEGPAFADSISEGDIKWLKEPGDYVEADELVAEIETDKTAVEVLAPQAGTIKEFIVADGDKVEARQKIFRLEVGGEAPAAKEKPSEEIAAPEAPKSDAKPAAKPSADSGPIPSDIPKPSKPQSAPISSKPVESIQKTPARPSQPRSAAARAPAPAKAGGVPPEQAITGARAETRIKMNRMRQKIASRLKEAQNTCAVLTTFNEIDMSTCMQMRNKYKDVFLKKHGIKFGFMSPFVRACAHALMDQPAVNAVIDEGEIVFRHFIDISVAVATPKGLVTPVLRGVESMNYAQIEHGINELGVKARDGALAIEDMDGGTFTISNGGVFGSMFGTPIINMPQSAILGMHGIFERPVAISGKVEIRPMMYVALTYDHRLIDGREAVLFLRKVKQSVEDPGSMLLDL